ncbi:N-terminal acetyltransferase A complex auxiliary subunit NAA15-like protein [Drosera capensis]
MDREPPSTLIWTLFLLAQHYDRRGQYEIDLEKIDEAIQHTPTVIDLYSAKFQDRLHSHAYFRKAASGAIRFEVASGESYFRQGDLGRALKIFFLAVEKHYAYITEDQFDFRSYSPSKMTLRTYVEMLKFQDRLHSHAYFHKAPSRANRWEVAPCDRCYIKLFDSPPKSGTEEDEEMAKLLPSPKKETKTKTEEG